MDVITSFTMLESKKSYFASLSKNESSKNFIEHCELKDYSFLRSIYENYTGNMLERIINEDFPLLDKIKNFGGSAIKSIQDKFKNVSLSSMADKIAQKIKDFKGEEPDATIMKAIKEKAVNKYLELKKTLGGSNTAAVIVLIGALLVFAIPFAGTPLTIAYFKAVYAIASRVISGKDVVSASEI